ncbi:MAG: ribosome silencing factor [Myxococcales bacterium]|nr:ribosome silencing factor [Myxococcales bacterium]HIK86562.1 ribosome silencing factor [Myxococcales bacterium]
MTETAPLKKARLIVEAALDRMAESPIVLDVSGLTAYADTFIILTGRSDRQVRSISEAVVHELKGDNEQPLGVEGLDDGNWVLIDCNDAIVHVFDPETRERYDLERLWRDAPRIDLEIDGVDPNPDGIETREEGDEQIADPAA